MRKIKFKVSKLSYILLIILISTLYLSLPKNDDIVFKDHKVSTSKGGAWNPNILVVSMLSNINGIEGSQRGKEVELELPFFTNNRYVRNINYTPWLGENRTEIKLEAIDNYSFTIKESKSKLIFHLHFLKLLYLIVLLFLVAWFKQRKNLPKITVTNVILSILIVTLFLQASILDMFTIFGVLLLSQLTMQKKYRYIMGTMVVIIALLLNAQISLGSKSIDLSGITKNKLVLKESEKVERDIDVGKAILAIEREYTSDGNLAVVDCHTALHELGLLTYLKFQDAKKALTYSSTHCEFGYLHGVEDAISLLSNNVIDSKEIYKNACEIASKNRAKSVYDECVHGSGHAFYDLYQGDQERAYRACKIWLESEISCMTAVTMSQGEYVKHEGNKIFFPNLCLEVEDATAQGGCLKMSFRYVFRDLNNLDADLMVAHKFCDKIKTELKEDCFYSIGQAAAFINLGNIDKVNPSMVGTYCTWNKELNDTCSNTFISYLSFYSTLYNKKIDLNSYCKVIVGKENNCVTMATKMNDRLEGSL